MNKSFEEWLEDEIVRTREALKDSSWEEFIKIQNQYMTLLKVKNCYEITHLT